MPCQEVKLPGVGTAIACTRGPRPLPKCSVCKQRASNRLCDFLVGAGKSCDAALCSHCAVPVRGDRNRRLDFCPTHPLGGYSRQQPLPL